MESDADSCSGLEEIQYQFEEASNEVVELEAELKAAELEAQQLQMRLKTVAAQCLRNGCVPIQATSGGSRPVVFPAAVAAEERRINEMAKVLEWLSEHVRLDSFDTFDVGFEVPISGRSVHLRKVSQWQMPTAPGGRLLVSVPIEHRDSIGQLLAFIQSKGCKVEMDIARRFAAVWDLVPGELATSQPSALNPSPKSEPSVLLAHRGSSQGVLIATWPTREALGAYARTSPAATVVTVGDKVEVQYEGVWYGGTMVSVDVGGRVSVRCDADPDGVLTITTIAHVRLTATPPTETQHAAASVTTPSSRATSLRIANEDTPSDRGSPFSSSQRKEESNSSGSVVIDKGTLLSDSYGPNTCNRLARHRRTRSAAL